MPLSAIALFPANPRAFYHLTNVFGLDFLALCAERQGATAYRRFRRWIFSQDHYPALCVDRILPGLPANADIGSAFHGLSCSAW
jgi:hypothetical protein